MPRDHTWLLTLSLLSRACHRLEASEPAAELYEPLFPHRAEMVVSHVLWAGAVAHDLGLLATTLGHYHDANSHFAAGAKTHERIGARAALSYPWLEWARMHLARRHRGDAKRARQLLEDARQQFEALAMANCVHQVDELLRRLSQPKGRLPGGLTQREADILRLVATGKTNEEIAAELHVSEKTVEHHLSSVFTKLGVASRAAATSFAHRHGIL